MRYSSIPSKSCCWQKLQEVLQKTGNLNCSSLITAVDMSAYVSSWLKPRCRSQQVLHSVHLSSLIYTQNAFCSGLNGTLFHLMAPCFHWNRKLLIVPCDRPCQL